MHNEVFGVHEEDVLRLEIGVGELQFVKDWKKN